MSRKFWRKWICAASVLSSVGGFTGCGGAKPEVVYQNWLTAVKAGNFSGVWECLTPQARGTVLQIMVLDADLLSGTNAGAKDAFSQVFSKYGLNPADATFKQARLQVANAAAYASDLNNVFRQFQGELAKLEASRFHKLNTIWTATAQANLGPSQTQGTRSVAPVQGKIPHTADNASVQAVFEKVDGQWLLAELEESAGGPPMAGAGGATKASGPPMAGGPAMAGGPGMAGGPPMGGPAMAGGPGPMGDAKPGLPGPGGPQIAMGPGGAAGPAAGGGLPADRPGMAAPLPGDQKGLPAGPDSIRPGAGGPPGAMPARPGNVPGPGGVIPGDPQAMAPKAGGPGALPIPGDPKAMAPKAGPPGAEPEPGDPKKMPKNPRGEPGDEDKPPGPGSIRPGAPNAEGLPAGGGNPTPGNVDGAGRAGGGYGGNQKKYKPGSWEYAVDTFTRRIAAGDYSELDHLISSRAKGLLAEIRKGEASDERLEELKSQFEEPTPQPETFKNSGSTLKITIKGKQGHHITLTVGKEDGVFKIRDMKISEPDESQKR